MRGVMRGESDDIQDNLPPSNPVCGELGAWSVIARFRPSSDGVLELAREGAWYTIRICPGADPETDFRTPKPGALRVMK